MNLTRQLKEIILRCHVVTHTKSVILLDNVFMLF